MNVALITPWKVRCGIASYSANLASSLARAEANVYVVRVPRFGPKTAEVMQDVVARVPVDKIDVIQVEHEYGIWQDFDAIFFGALKALGKPIATTMHAVGKWDTDEGIARCSEKVIVHNKFCFERFNHPENTVIIPHGAKPSECASKEESKKRYGMISKLPIVGYCGYISSYKGLETLIKAMEKVSAALVVAGGWFTDQDTQYIANLRDYSLKTLEGRCQWLNFIPDDQLPYAYGLMDVVVYPSRWATESGALIMALSYGKAIIASRTPPFIEKQEANALITFTTDFKKDQIADLAEKINAVLQSDELRLRLEEGAKNYATANSWDVVAQKHLHLYQELLKKN